MTKDDIEIFIMLVTRTSMMVHPENSDSITNFIQGYEYGTKNSCNFTQLSKQLLSDKYKIAYSNDGWPGQINRLAQNSFQSWTFTFKQITQEILSTESKGVFTDNIKEIIRSSIRSLINQLERPLYDGWTEKWLDLKSIDTWFPNQLWSDEQQSIIHSITNEINSKNIFSDKIKKTPSLKLVGLATRFKLTDIKPCEGNIM